MPVKGIVTEADYTFNKTAKTITFATSYAGIKLPDIMYITNVQQGVATVIYDPADATKGGMLVGLTLTLAYDTSAMNDTDCLQIIIGRLDTVAPLPIQDISNFEGKSSIELLSQILLELRILNYYISELPVMLQGKNSKFDEPAQLRNEQSLFKDN